MPAHPTLTAQLEHEIATLISAGVPLSTAARLLGIPPRTVRDWLVIGARPDAKPHWRRFAESVAAARTEHQQAVVVRLAQLRGRLD